VEDEPTSDLLGHREGGELAHPVPGRPRREGRGEQAGVDGRGERGHLEQVGWEVDDGVAGEPRGEPGFEVGRVVDAVRGPGSRRGHGEGQW